MSNYSWNTEETPYFGEISTIERPDLQTCREIALTARSVDVEKDRVTVDFGGLIAESQAPILKHELLFNVDPAFRDFNADGDVIFSAYKPVEIQGIDTAIVEIRVRGDPETHRVGEIKLTAKIF